MMNGICLLIMLSTFILGAAASGQIKKGDSEIDFVGSLNHISGGDETSATAFQLVAGGGHFFVEWVEIGANFSLTKYEGVDAFGTVSGFLSLYPKIEKSDKIAHFIGVQYGHAYGMGDSPTIHGAYCGTKIFVSTGAAITLQPYYSRYEYSHGGVDTYGVLTGISIFF